MSESEQCGKPAPTFWRPLGLVCIKPKGHPIVCDEDRGRIVGEGHETSDGRKWPVGKANMEFL